jgi:uncharacterized membrane protein
MDINTFFTEVQKKEILLAIEQAELNTSGEIRLHVEETCKIDPTVRAVKVFEKLKMNKTKLRNGVLFYIALGDKKFAIIGDKGINDLVEVNFWEDIKDAMLKFFIKDALSSGLCLGIQMAGMKLKTHFPYTLNDENELTNDISFQE